MTFTLGIPQLILLVLLLVHVVDEILDYAKGKKARREIWVTIASLTLLLGILWWGGFFG